MGFTFRFLSWAYLSRLGAGLALDAKVILAPPCIFH